jgi:hypothetical protein
MADSYLTDFDPELANHALEIAIEWGPNRRRPILERLAESCPHLHQLEVERYAGIAQDVEKRCFALVQAKVDAVGCGYSELLADCREMVVSEFPWLSEKNIAHLLTQGQYYACR